MRNPRLALVVMTVAVPAGAVLASSTRDWVRVEAGQALPGAATVLVDGGSAAAAVPALALVALAAAGALSLARRGGQVVSLVLVTLAAAGMLVGVAGVLMDPLGASRAEVGAATGLAAGSVQGLEAATSTTAWPVVTAALAVVVLAGAVLGWAGRRGWRATSRFDVPGAAREQLDTGQEQEPEGGTAQTVEPHEGWDRLSRGDDPTRD